MTRGTWAARVRVARDPDEDFELTLIYCDGCGGWQGEGAPDSHRCGSGAATRLKSLLENAGTNAEGSVVVEIALEGEFLRCSILRYCDGCQRWGQLGTTHLCGVTWRSKALEALADHVPPARPRTTSACARAPRLRSRPERAE